MKTRVMIVDDEDLAIEIIEQYLSNLPNIEIIARCNTGLEAFEEIHQKEPHLIFLDIQMPQLTGLDLIKSLKNPPKIIITTAHRKYAIEGFELDVIDYLLKPISFERFLKAMDKFYKSANIPGQSTVVNTGDNFEKEDFVYVKENRKLVKIKYDEILFVESLKDYVIVHTDKKKIITKERISVLEEKLPGDKFIRIHRSYIVSVSKISAITPVSLEIGSKELTIGRNYKNSVLKFLNFYNTN